MYNNWLWMRSMRLIGCLCQWYLQITRSLPVQKECQYCRFCYDGQKTNLIVYYICIVSFFIFFIFIFVFDLGGKQSKIIVMVARRTRISLLTKKKS